MPTNLASDQENSDSYNNKVTVIRSEHLSKPYNWARNFPEIYGAANFGEGAISARCLHSYYYDNVLNQHLIPGITYQSGLSTERIIVTYLDPPNHPEHISILNVDKYQLHVEILE